MGTRVCAIAMICCLAVLVAGCGESAGAPSPRDAGADSDGPSPEDAQASACSPGAIDSCYSGGAPAGELMGACAAGVRVCAPDGSGFSECIGEVTPVGETCATPVDDDCDGLINEEGVDCACTPGAANECYSGPAATLAIGACKSGTQVCNPNGQGYGPCFGEVTPGVETCASPVDEDCDGELNEEGEGCVCAPNAIESCYSGPAGTADVGACKSGARTCNALGTGWGPCVGEVLPGFDACSGVGDENCDGALDEGCAAWVKHFGGKGIVRSYATVNSQTDRAYVTGWFTEGVDLQIATNPTGAGAFVARVDATGALAWAKAFVANDYGFQLSGIAAFGESFEPASVFVAGEALGTVDFGGGPLASLSGETSPDLVLAAFDFMGGHAWSKRFKCDGEMAVMDVVGRDPATVVAGAAKGAIDLGAGSMSAIGGGDIFAAMYGKSGQTHWSRRFGDPASTKSPASIAVAFGDSVVLATRVYGPIDFGGGTLPSGSVIASLDGSGQHVWSKHLASGDSFSVMDVAVDAQGGILLVGSSVLDVDLGGGTLPGGNTGSDVVIAKLASTGTHQWSRRFSGTGSDYGYQLAATTDGGVLAMGTYDGTIQFGTQPLSPGAQGGVFLVKLDASGQHVFSRGFTPLGGPTVPSVLSLSPTPTGGAVGTLEVSGAIDLGLGPISPATANDALVFFFPVVPAP